MESIIPHLTELISAISRMSNATMFMIAILGVCAWMLHRANADPQNPIRWEDLVLDVETNKASPYKIGYLIGVMVATWIVISLVDAGKLQVDMFVTYLGFLLGGAGWQMAMNRGQKSTTSPSTYNQFASPPQYQQMPTQSPQAQSMSVKQDLPPDIRLP